MAKAVLDASVVLASLQDEPGRALADAIAADAAISSVNFAEVVSKLSGDGVPPVVIEETLRLWPLEIVPVDGALALAAGLLRAETRHLGLSLGDRFCLALGRQLALPIYTAKRRWVTLSPAFDVRLIR